jgi:adenylate cyclase
MVAPLRRGNGETIAAAFLFAEGRDFTAPSENSPPLEVISALEAWFDWIAGSVHASAAQCSNSWATAC